MQLKLRDRNYTLRSHTENLVALLDHLGAGDLTLFGQDWGSPIATAYTVRHAERVKRIFFANTIAGYGQVDDPDIPTVGDSQWFRWIGDGLETGRTEAVLRNAGSTVLSAMKIIGFQKHPSRWALSETQTSYCGSDASGTDAVRGQPVRRWRYSSIANSCATALV